MQWRMASPFRRDRPCHLNDGKVVSMLPLEPKSNFNVEALSIYSYGGLSARMPPDKNATNAHSHAPRTRQLMRLSNSDKRKSSKVCMSTLWTHIIPHPVRPTHGSSKSHIVHNAVRTLPHHRMFLITFVPLAKNGLGISGSVSGSQVATSLSAAFIVGLISMLNGLPPARACCSSTNVLPPRFRCITPLSISSPPAVAALLSSGLACAF